MKLLVLVGCSIFYPCQHGGMVDQIFKNYLAIAPWKNDCLTQDPLELNLKQFNPPKKNDIDYSYLSHQSPTVPPC